MRDGLTGLTGLTGRAKICFDLSGTCKVAKFCEVLSLQLCILIYLSLWLKA